MNANKPPVSILLIACLYLVVGSFGFVRNLHAFGHPDFMWIELTEVLAVIAGAFMLRGRNWARWIALLWMGFHVALTLVTQQNLVVHALIFALIAWVLFRPEARHYFRVG